MSTDVAEGSFIPLSLPFAEALYADYLKDPNSVPADWRELFSKIGPGEFAKEPRLGPSFRPASLFNPPAPGANGANGANGHAAAALAKTNGNGHAQAVVTEGVS